MSENNTSVTSEHDVGAATKARPGGVMLTVYRWAPLKILAAGVVQIFLPAWAPSSSCRGR